MPFLFNGIKAFFGFLFEKILKKMGDKAAKYPIIAGFFAMSVVIVATYLTAMNALVVALNYSIPSIVMEVGGWFLPSNTPLILSSVYGSRIIRWAYIKHLNALKFKAKALTSA